MSINYTVRTRNGGIQYRIDPLTGGPSRINPARSLRPKAAAVAAPNDCVSPTTPDASSTSHLPRDTEALVLASKERDPFFPREKLYRSIVPLARPFLNHIAPDAGIDTTRSVMELGDACLFLNLFPFAENHAVITTSHKYYVSMPDTTPRQISDALALATEFCSIAAREDAPPCSEPGALSPGALDSATTAVAGDPSGIDRARAPLTRYLWPSVVWNYMPSSAGSIVHPHLQCFAETVAPPLAAAAAREAGKWAEKHQQQRAQAGVGSGLKGYYGALVDQELALLSSPHPAITAYAAAAAAASTGSAASPAEALAALARIGADPNAAGGLSRYIGKVGQVHVIAPFAPRTNREVHICVPVPTLASLARSPSLQHDTAAAVAAVVQCYHRCGVGAFNLASFAAPELRVPVSGDHDVHAGDDAFAVDSHDESVGGFREEWRASSTLTLRMFSRPYPSGIYTSDSGPAERLYDLNIVETLPEVYAAEMRAMWEECSKARV